MFEKFKEKIITIEGADGTGKDTVCNILQQKIKGSIIVRFPNRENRSGKIIDAILRKQLPMEPLSFQCLQVINKIETLQEIEQEYNIEEIPKFFMCRYYPSAYAYGLNDKIPLEYSEQINSILPKSWLTFILDGKNYGKHEEYYETDKVQLGIKATYQNLAEHYGWALISNHDKPDQVTNKILAYIEDGGCEMYKNDSRPNGFI